MDFTIVLGILVQFAQLAGVAALLAAVVNIFKYFGVVKDGTAGSWYAAFSLVTMALLVYFHYFIPTIGIEFLDAQAAILAKILLIVLGYVMQLKVGSGTANTLKNMEIPVLGATNSDKGTLLSRSDSPFVSVIPR